MTQRSSDIVEQYSAKALGAGIGGVVALGAGIILFVGAGAGMVGLASVLALAGVGLIGFAISCMVKAKQVGGVGVVCCYCQYKNMLTEAPTKDFTCQRCNRLVPIENGQVLDVSQVRCGYCNGLNYYSSKTEVLLCEDCNREVPVSIEDGRVRKNLPKGFARVDDENSYELVLVSSNGQHTEELISALQHMLALNRNQVKQMLTEMPIILLSGIPRMKAEMLQAQLTTHGGKAEFKALS